MFSSIYLLIVDVVLQMKISIELFRVKINLKISFIRKSKYLKH